MESLLKICWSIEKGSIAEKESEAAAGLPARGLAFFFCVMSGESRTSGNREAIGRCSLWELARCLILPQNLPLLFSQNTLTLSKVSDRINLYARLRMSVNLIFYAEAYRVIIESLSRGFLEICARGIFEVEILYTGRK